MAYVLGSDLSAAKGLATQEIKERHPAWADTQAFVRAVESARLSAVRRTKAKGAEKGSTGAKGAPQRTFTFDQVSGVVSEIGEKYGGWRDQECSDVRAQL